MEKPLAMHTFENLNIGEVCRSCFESCEQYKMLYEDAENSEKRSLGDVFFDVVKIEVKTSIDQSPSRICLACFRDLINAYNFIQKSKHNNDRFVEYLKTTGLRQDCLSEFPIDIPNDTTPADYHLQIKIENEAINDYDDSLADDKISPGSTSGSADSSDYEEPLHNKVKINKMQCPYCERIFKRQDFLENHKRKHEEEIKKKKEAGEEISTFVCDECGLSFGIKKDFDEHLTNEHPARLPRKTKRNALTLQEKINLISFSEENKQSIRNIAALFDIGKSQVASILSRKQELLDEWESNKTTTQQKRRFISSHGSRIDETVFQWFLESRSRGYPIGGTAIRQHAAEVAKQLGVTDFKASSGWLYKFRKRHDITLKK